MDRIRLAVIDSHTLVREVLGACLTRMGSFEVLAFDGRDASWLDEIVASSPHVALLELRLPQSADWRAGVAVLQALRDRLPDLPVVVLTLEVDAEAVEACYAAGAAAYLLKASVSFDEVGGMLQAAARGERRFPVDLLSSFGRLSQPARVSPGQQQLAQLTGREREVLAQIAAGHDNLKIGALLGISERTVKSHVAGIYRKLRVENRVQLALLARELGLNAEREDGTGVPAGG